MLRISVGISIRPTGNGTALSQASFLRNHILLIVAVLMRHTRTSAIPYLQQQKYQYHAVIGITTDRAGMRSASTCTRFFFRQEGVRQLAQLHPPSFLGLTKNEKIAGLKLPISSTLRAPVGWHGIQSTT